MARASKHSTPGAGRRGKGRPGEQGTVGKDAIVAAAVDLFRTRTPNSLTLLDIATHAGVDPALVRYYFGSKEGLMTATVARLMTERQDAHRALMPQQGSVENRLRQRMLTGLQLQRMHPNFHQLVVERIFKAETPEAREALEMTAARGLALTVAFLHAGDSGAKLRNVDPRFLNIALVGLCEFFVSAQTLVEASCGRPMDDEMVENYADFVVDLLVNGLRPAPASAPSRAPQTEDQTSS